MGAEIVKITRKTTTITTKLENMGENSANNPKDGGNNKELKLIKTDNKYA